MPGQAIVTIGNNQWTVSIASTFDELVNGLSGVASIPASSGMLFDLGADYQFIPIDMSRMLFPLDIIFIGSQQGVIGLLRDAAPGEEAYFEAVSAPAKYFLEVNAAEAEGIEIGDSVVIEGSVQNGSVYPAFWTAIATAVAAGLAGAIASKAILKGGRGS